MTVLSLSRRQLLAVAAASGVAATALLFLYRRQRRSAALTAAAQRLTGSVLKRQDATTSDAVIATLAADPCFQALAAKATATTIARDREDDEKLAAGIKLAVDKGVLSGDLVPAPYTNIQSKSVDEVTDEIVAGLGNAAKTGSVIVLVGLSGTGKGTTVARLAEILPNSTTWSNGNVFRSLTLLAVKWCEKQGLPAFDPALALTPANLRSFMAMLEFDRFDGKFDIKINAPDLGVVKMVDGIKNTDLKAPEVGKNIPTVANVTQGEVVAFVAAATKKMGEAGMNVLIEGREATVDHIPTPFRFKLTLSDVGIIGKRRAAQVIGAAALEALGDKVDGASEEEVREAVMEALRQRAKDE